MKTGLNNFRDRKCAVPRRQVQSIISLIFFIRLLCVHTPVFAALTRFKKMKNKNHHLRVRRICDFLSLTAYNRSRFFCLHFPEAQFFLLTAFGSWVELCAVWAGSFYLIFFFSFNDATTASATGDFFCKLTSLLHICPFYTWPCDDFFFKNPFVATHRC